MVGLHPSTARSYITTELTQCSTSFVNSSPPLSHSLLNTTSSPVVLPILSHYQRAILFLHCTLHGVKRSVHIVAYDSECRSVAPLTTGHISHEHDHNNPTHQRLHLTFRLRFPLDGKQQIPSVHLNVPTHWRNVHISGYDCSCYGNGFAALAGWRMPTVQPTRR